MQTTDNVTTRYEGASAGHVPGGEPQRGCAAGSTSFASPGLSIGTSAKNTSFSVRASRMPLM